MYPVFVTYQVCAYICVYVHHIHVFFRKIHTFNTGGGSSTGVILGAFFWPKKNSGRQQSLRITTWMVESCTGVGFVGALTHRFRTEGYEDTRAYVLHRFASLLFLNINIHIYIYI